MTMENLIRSQDIIGKTVVDEEGRRVGTVEDINFDPQAWHVDGILVTLEDEAAEALGEKRPMLGMGKAQLNIRTPRINNAGDFVLLKGTLRDMARALHEGGGQYGGPPR